MLGYFGPEGTFTHQALLTLGEGTEATAFPTVAAALDAVRRGEVEASLVPIENSVEGGVSATLDSLSVRPSLQIVREVLLDIQFVLAVRPGAELSQVRRVITHPHAAAQCRTWVSEHLPDAELIERGSTAAAAVEVANPESSYDAAICAAVAAELYGLDILADGVADNGGAVTRFVLVRCPGPPPERTGHDKTTLVAYMRADHPGALLEILQQFAVRGVNLCRIESRPTKTMLGSYCFSIDAEGHIDDMRISEAMMGLHRVCARVDFLGSYERADLVAPMVPYGGNDEDYGTALDWVRRLRS